MTSDPRSHREYAQRQVEAARRVLVDLGQVLGSWFDDSIVVVGGWVPDLLLHAPEEPHVGSIDVDLALDPAKLTEGRYAEIVRALLATRRYDKTESPFRLRASVELGDGGEAVVVDIDFMKPLERRRGSRRKARRILEDFRPLDADGCAAAFRHPHPVRVRGHTIVGAENTVTLLVAAIEDFLIMKSYALAKRDKPKDAYDVCYCLDHVAGGMEPIARSWRARRDEPLVANAIAFLRDKFASVRAFGPQQVVAFYDDVGEEARAMRARRAHELVRRFLTLIEGSAG